MIRARYLAGLLGAFSVTLCGVGWRGTAGEVAGGGGRRFAAEAPKGAPQAKKAEKKPEKKAAPERHDLETWGAIKPVKGTEFWEIRYAQTDERGRRVAKHAFFKPAADTEIYTDRAVAITDLKEGETVWLFGKRFEQEIPAIPGMPGVDRQMKNVAAMVTGEGVKVSSARTDPKDPGIRWFETKLSKAGPAPYVTYDGVEYKVVALRDLRVVRREKSGDAGKLKNNMYVAVCLAKSEERPNTGKSADAKKDSFVAKTVVILDAKLTSTLYPLMMD